MKLVPVAFECIGRNNLKELWNWCGSDPAECLSKFDEDFCVGNNQKLKKINIFVYNWEGCLGNKIRGVA